MSYCEKLGGKHVVYLTFIWNGIWVQSPVKKGVCWAIFGCAVSLQKDKTRPPVAGDRPSSTVRWHRGTNSHFFKRFSRTFTTVCLSILEKGNKFSMGCQIFKFEKHESVGYHKKDPRTLPMSKLKYFRNFKDCFFRNLIK